MLAAGRAVSKQLGDLIVKEIPKGSSSLEIWNSLCLPRGQGDAPVLLLPEGYELLNPGNNSRKMVELLQASIIPLLWILQEDACIHSPAARSSHAQSCIQPCQSEHGSPFISCNKLPGVEMSTHPA